MTLLKVPKIVEYAPLQRSQVKVQAICDLIISKNPKLKHNLTPEFIQKDFASYLSVTYKARLQQAVYTQKVNSKSMKSLYKPLSESYNSGKPKFSKDKFWIETGWLISNLQIWESNKNYNIGFKKNQLHPSGAEAQLILLWLEKGTRNKDGSQKIPPRPLFIPIASFIRKNISAYFKQYLKLRWKMS